MGAVSVLLVCFFTSYRDYVSRRRDVNVDGSLTYSAFLKLILTREHGGQFRPRKRLDLADSYEWRLSTFRMEPTHFLIQIPS